MTTFPPRPTSTSSPIGTPLSTGRIPRITRGGAQECDRQERSGLKPEPFEPTDADWDEMARWCEWVEMKDRESLYTDDDIQAAGLPVG